MASVAPAAPPAPQYWGSSMVSPQYGGVGGAAEQLPPTKKPLALGARGYTHAVPPNFNNGFGNKRILPNPLVSQVCCPLPAANGCLRGPLLWTTNLFIRSVSVARFRSPAHRWFSLSSLLEGLAVNDPSSLKPYPQVLVLVIAFGIKSGRYWTRTSDLHDVNVAL